jgi:carbamoylphosphate synthase small subunit
MNYVGPEVEAIYMPLLKAVGVQWHPEATPIGGPWNTGTAWFNHLVNDLLTKPVDQIKRLYLGSCSQLNMAEVR